MPAETREQSASVGEEIRGPGKGLVLATTAHAHSRITRDSEKVASGLGGLRLVRL